MERVRLDKMSITKADLLSIPSAERTLLIQLMRIMNEISILNKLTIFTMNRKCVIEVEKNSQTSQALFLTRLHVGLLREAWQFLSDQYFGTKLSKEYEPALPSKGKKALGKLKSYFGKGNLIHDVRNEFAFHYSAESSAKIDEVLVHSPDEPSDFEIYWSESVGNCVYTISDALVNKAALKLTGLPDSEAQRKVMRDVQRVTGWFLEFAGHSIVVIFEKYLCLESSEIRGPELKNIDDVMIPFFVSRGGSHA